MDLKCDTTLRSCSLTVCCLWGGAVVMSPSLLPCLGDLDKVWSHLLKSPSSLWHQNDSRVQVENTG